MEIDVKFVISQGGGPTKLGRAIGLSHSAILCWKQIPARHVPAVSLHTGIPRHELRPDLWEAPEQAA